MDQYKKFSDKVYGVENEKMKSGDVFRDKKDKYLVLDTIDTNKDILNGENNPRKNSMQAMAVAEIKDEYKSYREEKLKEIKGYPASVVTKEITIAYAGTSSLKDWTTNVIEIGLNAKYENGAFASAVDYAKEIERK